MEISDVDLMARIHWENILKPKKQCLKGQIQRGALVIVEGNEKRERLNCITHILSKIPYTDVDHEKVELPNFSIRLREKTLPDELYVPKFY